MSEDEKRIMQEHSLYWKNLMAKGFVVVYGPVMDPKGHYGTVIISADNKERGNESRGHTCFKNKYL